MSGGTIGSGIGAIVGGIVGSIIPGVGTMLGMYIGSMVGGIAGNLLFPPEMEDMYGPRNRNLQLPGSAFGNPIAKTWGTDRHAGNLIWTSGVREIPVETEASSKGGSSQTTINFVYRASYAVLIATYAGPNTKLLRIWSDNKLILDLTGDNTKLAKPPGLNYRFYIGAEDQEPDPTMVSFEGEGNVPAHRGSIYIVYEDRDLTPYGGRYPSDNFEITTNGTAAYPYELFNVPHTWVAADSIHIDPTGTLLYYSDANHFTIINLIDNTYKIHDFVPSEPLQYYTGTDIVKIGGGWWTCKQAIGTVYFGKTDDYLGNYIYVVEPTSGLPIWYPVFGGIVDCEIFVWLYNSGGCFQITPDLIPLHSCTPHTTHYDAVPTFAPTGDEQILGACWAKNLGFIAVGHKAGSPGTPSTLYIWRDSESKVTEYDLSSYLLAELVGYEPDNGWIYVYGQVGGISGHNGICIFDSSGNLVKEMSETFTATASALRNISNHQLWVNSGANFHQIDTLTGEIVRTINSALWVGVSPGGTIYDGASNALWVESTSPTLVKILLDRAGGDKVYLWQIVKAICNEVSLLDAEIDVAELTNLVWGYTIPQRMPARRAIEPLQLAYFFDGVESDAKIKFLKRALRTSVVTIPEDDLSCHDPDQEPPDPVAISRQFELELPRQLDLEYVDPNKDYQQGKQTSTRLITLGKEQKTVTLPICLEPDEAKQISEILHYLMWLERNRAKKSLSRKYAYIDNCDVITVITSERTYVLRITKLDYGAQGLILVESVPHDPAAFVSDSEGNESEWVPGTNIDSPGQTIWYFMDVPFFRDQDQAYHPDGFYVALSKGAPGWRGAIIYKSTDGINFAPAMTGMNSAKQGVMLGALVAVDDPNVWDDVSSVNVQLFNSDDTLSSITELAVLNGGNPCVIGKEICQFKDVALVSSDPKVYTLTNFLRGRRGTEHMTADHAAGERFVFLTPTTVYRSPLDASEIGLQRFYSVVSLGNKLDPAIKSPFYGYAAGLKPYSPVHIEKTLDGSNNYALTWIRRTRIGGSWRDLVDVPIAETEEKYEVDLYDENESLLRTKVGITSPTCGYTAAEQTADGITPGDPILASIYQMSAVVGRGFKGGDGPQAYTVPIVPPQPQPTGTEIINSTNFTFGLGAGQSVSYYYDKAGVSIRTDINVYNDALTGIFSYKVTRPDGTQTTGSVMYGQRLTVTIVAADPSGYYTIELTGIQTAQGGLLRLTVFAY